MKARRNRRNLKAVVRTFVARRKTIGGRDFWHVERPAGSCICACGRSKSDAELIARLLADANMKAEAPK